VFDAIKLEIKSKKKSLCAYKLKNNSKYMDIENLKWKILRTKWASLLIFKTVIFVLGEKPFYSE
jgi:hypothetical protein